MVVVFWFFFFSSRRRHTRLQGDWSSDVWSSDLQNVDGLHTAAGSDGAIDLHGRIAAVRCMGCGAGMERAVLQAMLLERNPGWAGLSAQAAPDGDADLEGRDFSRFDVPACPHCGGVLKPDVVFYGEGVPSQRVQAVRAMLQQAGGLLVAGSSLMV